jgi:hypothetical protein
MIKYAPEASYIVIMTRDFFVISVMVYFIVRVNKPETNIKVEMAKTDTEYDL